MSIKQQAKDRIKIVLRAFGLVPASNYDWYKGKSEKSLGKLKKKLEKQQEKQIELEAKIKKLLKLYPRGGAEDIINQTRQLFSVDSTFAKEFVQKWQAETRNIESINYASSVAFAIFMYKAKFYARVLEAVAEVPKEYIQEKMPFEYFSAQAYCSCLDVPGILLYIENKMNEGKYIEAFKYSEILAVAHELNYFYECIGKVAPFITEQKYKRAYDRVQWYLKFKKEKETTPIEDPETVNFGIINYDTLDSKITSDNYGDYVQSLALLSNLARYENLSFVSDVPGLADLMKSYQIREHAPIHTEFQHNKVNVIPFNRDFSNNQNLPRKTWSIVFGWYMHHNFSKWYDFPLNRNIIPIFLSFHISRREILTKEGISYLKKYAPIGCRDWSTVYILSEYGIPAFFSGCVTTTIGQIYEQNSNSNGRIANVEAVNAEQSSVPEDRFSNVSPAVRLLDFVSGLKAADKILMQYGEYDSIITSRLHCYLPCKSMGKTVSFYPKNWADSRYDGLIPSSSFEQIRERMSSLLEQIFETIIQTNNEEIVFNKWKNITEKYVAEANDVLKKVEHPVIKGFNLKDVISKLKNDKITLNDENKNPSVKLAFAVDANLFINLPVVIESIASNTKEYIEINILGRDLKESWLRFLALSFPKIKFNYYPCDIVSYGEDIALMSHITVSTMDRLLLPEILEKDEKVLYLDVDIIVEGDISELYNLDIVNYRYAGKKSDHSSWVTCDKLLERAASNCPMTDARILRRLVSSHGCLNFRAANAGVTLMNLTKMREEHFVENYVPYVEQYHLNDQDVLNFYSMGNRLEIPDGWNVYAYQQSVSGAKLIHFAGRAKPWGQNYIAGKEIFDKYKKQYFDRVGDIPSCDVSLK